LPPYIEIIYGGSVFEPSPKERAGRGRTKPLQLLFTFANCKANKFMTDTTKPLVNRVAQSALITLDLEEYFPKPEDLAFIDLKEYLFKGLILREADFREVVKNTKWGQYKDKYVAIYCSTNAIIPMWAYMVLTSELAPYALDITCSNAELAAEKFLLHNLAKLDKEQFKGQRVVVKGCGDRKVPEAAFVQITQQLTNIARSIMYGEPCSTVPVFKKSVD
jgi:hypothetical protein